MRATSIGMNPMKFPLNVYGRCLGAVEDHRGFLYIANAVFYEVGVCNKYYLPNPGRG
jgi:hypothetical protein